MADQIPGLSKRVSSLVDPEIVDHIEMTLNALCQQFPAYLRTRDAAAMEEISLSAVAIYRLARELVDRGDAAEQRVSPRTESVGPRRARQLREY